MTKRRTVACVNENAKTVFFLRFQRFKPNMPFRLVFNLVEFMRASASEGMRTQYM